MPNVLSRFVAVQVARNLKKPEWSLCGYILNELLFKRKNRALEAAAVDLCDLRPGQTALEIGFGPGLGITYAAERVAPLTVSAIRDRNMRQYFFKPIGSYHQDGEGHVYGIEISDFMLDLASRRNKYLIGSGIVTLQLASVHHLPLLANSVDACFHVNSFYFWPDLPYALSQIWRVLRTDGHLVTTFRPHSLRFASNRGWMRYARPDPLAYVLALEACGFDRIEWLKSTTLGQSVEPFDAIVARKPAVRLLNACSVPAK